MSKVANINLTTLTVIDEHSLHAEQFKELVVDNVYITNMFEGDLQDVISVLEVYGIESEINIDEKEIIKWVH